MTQGTRVDPHVKILDERVVQRAKARGLDVLVYAPHFTRWPDIQEKASEFSDDELLVVPGRELFTGSWRTRRHVLALDLDRPIPDFVTLEGAMQELDRQGAVVLVPHPGFATVSLEHEHVGTYKDQIDAVEVYNPKHWPWNNSKARGIADAFDKPHFASSYAHRHGTVGEVWTRFDAQIGEAADLHTAFREGTPRSVHHRGSLTHVGRKALEFSHLFWENSYKKFDRVYLSGTEPTHPGHVAYEGNFDDIRVY